MVKTPAFDSRSAPPNGAPDIIMHGGTIVTLDREIPRAEAVAVKNGRVQAIGRRRGIVETAGKKTEVIDLHGLTIVPGFNDVHAHMEREGLKEQRLSLAGASCIDDILRRIADQTKTTPPGEWIVTMPVGASPHYFGGPETLAEGRMPTSRELDRVAPDNPVCISAVFGNWGAPPGYTALNSRALQLNGITRDTEPRCKGVEILRDTAGEPSGVLVEHNARPTVEFDVLPAVPRFTYCDRVQGIRRSMQLYNAVGTTSVYEGHGSAAQTIAAYRELWEGGELTVRVALVVSPAWRDVAEARAVMRDWLAYARGRGLGDPWLTISGVHIALGGDAVVAELARRDLPNTGWSGFVEQANSLGDYRDYCMLAAEYDLRVHTIVADLLADVVPILEKVAERHPIGRRRWVIEHIGRARVEDLKKLKQLGLFVTTIPAYFVWKEGGRYVDDPDFGDSVVPHRSLLTLGVPISCATDNIPYDPFFTMWVAATRHERHQNRVLGPNQRLSGEQALRLMTAEGAWLTFEEDRKGAITPNNFADLAVLSDDPTKVDPEELKDLQCHATMVDGKLIFGDL